MNKVIHLVIVSIWLLGWISLPEVGAIHSIEDAGNQLHKILFKILLIISLISWMLYSKVRFGVFLKRAELFLLFITINLFLLPLSQNPFYSATRLVEFSFMILSAYLIVFSSTNLDQLNQRIKQIFLLLTIYIFIALIVFFLSPEWGAKFAGFDPESGDSKYRFGGALLRVDLVSILSGACLMYWIFTIDVIKKQNTIVYIFLVSTSVLALMLAHSRSALVTATIVFIFFNLKNIKRNILFSTFFVVFVLVGLAFNFEEVINFYTRGETSENILSGSGRTYLFEALMAINSWLNIIIGNGYLMNSPNGLYFYVPKMYTDMASPHNGYLSILLGSGIVGLLNVLAIHFKIYRNIKLILRIRINNKYKWIYPTFIFLTITTLFDYGIWGVTSPALMIFTVIFFTTLFVTKHR